MTLVNKMVQQILNLDKALWHPKKNFGQAFAPSNIALCKYWGKRNEELNLPLTNSLSVSLGNYGATTKIAEIEAKQDSICLNQVEINPIAINSETKKISAKLDGPLSSMQKQFCERLSQFLDPFRKTPNTRFRIETEVNIPIAAGLASSACGFAALVKALADLYQWNIAEKDLSILARLGSGSACRSLWNGFVEWERGERNDGLDSHGIHLKQKFPELRLGLYIVDESKKAISSRQAMKNTKETSLFFSLWPEKVQEDLQAIKTAILAQDFTVLGKTAESNALAMHALMLTANPPVLYFSPATIKAMQEVWLCRTDGIEVYFTQDAGPNLKLLFLAKDTELVQARFKGLNVIAPFSVMSNTSMNSTDSSHTQSETQTETFDV